MEWTKFYNKQNSIHGFLGNLFPHSLLFEIIIQQKPSSILEVGTGTGSMSIFLSHLGYLVTSIDNDREILQNAKAFNETMNGTVNFQYCDAFKLSQIFKPKQFDTIFSQGFFEHFTNDEIQNLIKQQLTIGKTVIFSVPSKYNLHSTMNYERLLSLEEWNKILVFCTNKTIKYYGKPGIKNALKQFLKHPYPPIKKPQHLLIIIRSD